MIRLVARGHQVTVLTTTTRRPGVVTPAGERQAGVRRELDWWWDDHRIISPSPQRRLTIEWRNHRALNRAIAEVRPDVVSVWNMGGMSLGLLTSVARQRIPMVLAVCDDWLIYGPTLDAWSRMFLGLSRLGQLVASVTGLPANLPVRSWPGAYCFVSEFTRRAAERDSGWFFPLSTVVGSGIEAGEFATAPVMTPREWDWRLLYVGRVEPRKGVETAIRALCRLPARATLQITGPADPVHRNALDILVEELGLRGRVVFTQVDRSELAATYRRADVLIFPPVWSEPFGLVPVEAMACETPVVATGTGGSGEFLTDDQNCLLFPAGDVEALAGVLRRLAGDGPLRQRLVEGGRKTASELTVDRLADVFESWHMAASGQVKSSTPRP